MCKKVKILRARLPLRVPSDWWYFMNHSGRQVLLLQNRNGCRRAICKCERCLKEVLTQMWTITFFRAIILRFHQRNCRRLRRHYCYFGKGYAKGNFTNFLLLPCKKMSMEPNVWKNKVCSAKRNIYISSRSL